MSLGIKISFALETVSGCQQCLTDEAILINTISNSSMYQLKLLIFKFVKIIFSSISVCKIMLVTGSNRNLQFHNCMSKYSQLICQKKEIKRERKKRKTHDIEYFALSAECLLALCLFLHLCSFCFHLFPVFLFIQSLHRPSLWCHQGPI